MFTGLVERTGRLRHIERKQAGVSLRIAASAEWVAELTLGESVACDGACLTVTAMRQDEFAVDVSAETLARTTLGQRKVGEPLHLERALRVGDRLGGHWVTGHIDGVGQILSKRAVGETLEVQVQVPEPLMRYLVQKGSIAIDGVSLTVNTVADHTRSFSVVLIPHTQQVVTLHQRAVSAPVNLEVDILGKYVERLLGGGAPAGAAEAGVQWAQLAQAGFVKPR